jgi:hypothetical protein
VSPPPTRSSFPAHALKNPIKSAGAQRHQRIIKGKRYLIPLSLIYPDYSSIDYRDSSQNKKKQRGFRKRSLIDFYMLYLLLDEPVKSILSLCV